MDETISRLRAEGDTLDGLVADLDEADWRRPTPAEGWTIAHQIGHLAWTDEVALVAVTDPKAFNDVVVEALDRPGLVDAEAAERAALAPADLLARWRTGRARLSDALAAVDGSTKIPWFGTSMSPRSMATARIMETWAHGQDVADALGARRAPSAGLQDIAHLGIRTRDFSYGINELPPPAQEFRIELTGPDGDVWAWGPADAAERVTGTAEDFCLVVTQRRELDEVGLTVTGDEAARWLGIAQAFAGPPSPEARQARRDRAGQAGHA